MKNLFSNFNLKSLLTPVVDKIENLKVNGILYFPKGMYFKGSKSIKTIKENLDN